MTDFNKFGINSQETNPRIYKPKQEYIFTPSILARRKLEADWKVTIKIELIRAHPSMKGFIDLNPVFLETLITRQAYLA